MSLFRPSLESSPSAALAEAVPPVADPAVGGRIQRTSEILGEAIMDSVSSVRDSLPEQYRKHFETLRQEIIDFAQVHGISKESLGKPDLLREAANKLSTSDLERLADLLERFEHLIVYKEPRKEEINLTEALEYVETRYHLKEQYTSQVTLLEQVGILKEGAILGIDGNKYPIPTLEQIAIRLFERRETLKTKHDQGFTKLLLVPFGMSLDTLQETLKRFLLDYKQSHPTFELDTNEPLWTLGGYRGVDIGDSPELVYYPQSFTKEGHGGKTKREIFEGQETPGQARGDKGRQSDNGWKGWTVHLLQPSNLDTQDTETPKGFAPIPRKGKGIFQGNFIPRPPLETGQSPNKYLSILQSFKEDKNSPYFQESGMISEDWIIAFMLHLTETGRLLDNYANDTESISYLTGAFFLSSADVPCAYWSHGLRMVNLDGYDPRILDVRVGARSSVMI